MEEALQNDVILRHLFHFLSTPDLIRRCSLVNKQWNFEALSFVRDCRKCFARVADTNPDTTLNALNRDLRRMSTDRSVPYDGLYLNIAPHQQRGETPQFCTRFHQELDFIESYWPLKYLKIRWERRDPWKPYCPCARMIPSLLTNNSSRLEELTIEVLPWWNMYGSPYFYSGGIQMIFDDLFSIEGDKESRDDDSRYQRFMLTNLRKLKWNIEYEFLGFKNSKFIPWLLQNGTPRLQELDVRILSEMDFDSIIPKEKLKLIKRFHFSGSYTGLPRMLELQEAKPKLQELEISSVSQLKEWEVVFEILHASSGTLEVSDLEFFRVMACDMPTLPNLRELKMIVNPFLLHENETYQDQISSMDFARLFPRCSTLEFRLTIEFLGFERERLVDRGFPRQHETVGGRGGFGVKVLNVDYGDDLAGLHITVPHLSRIFPNVETLSLIKTIDRVEHCVWTAWSHLRSLTLIPYLYRHERFKRWRFESVICGIHPKELTELRKMDDDYLSKVHIVPSRPPMSYLQGLQRLQIKFDAYAKTRADVGALLRMVEPELISRVSYFLVFKRMTGLRVTVEGSPEILGIGSERMIQGMNVIPVPSRESENLRNSNLLAACVRFSFETM